MMVPKGELHPMDQKIFDDHPSDIWESMMRLHGSHINHTTPHFGPMLYWIIRAIGACNVIEIGVAQGYTSWFMAQAIKDNNIRYSMKGKYVAIDIDDKRPLFDPWKEEGMPVEFWQMNSVEVPEDKLAECKWDLIFQDGWHNTKHCTKELEMYYPHLKDNGNGYWIMHDVYSWCEEYYDLVMEKKNEYPFEAIRFLNNYGLAICRNMKNYDHSKRFWPQGDQPESEGFVC